MTGDLNATFRHRPFIKNRRVAVDRVLSYIVRLRCISSLSFMPLVPYPARFARHLPLKGKAIKERRFAPIHIRGETAARSLKAGISGQGLEAASHQSPVTSH